MAPLQLIDAENNLITREKTTINGQTYPSNKPSFVRQ